MEVQDAWKLVLHPIPSVAAALLVLQLSLPMSPQMDGCDPLPSRMPHDTTVDLPGTKGSLPPGDAPNV